MIMASTLCTFTFCGSSSSSSSSSIVGSVKTTMYSISSCSCSTSATNSCIKALKFPVFSRFSHMGLSNFTPWNGLKHMGISISARPQKIGRNAKCRGKVVYASLFGVGAPEALVIGVVALLVFGPKGLAEVARNLGKTLRTFQPTIRELQDVSREFKSTLEREIGLDEVASQTRSTYESNKANVTPNSSNSNSESLTAPVADPNGALSGEDYFKMQEEQLRAHREMMSAPREIKVETESQPQASAALEQDVVSTPPEPQIESEIQAQAAQQDVASSPPENTVGSESQPQAIIQETATAAPSFQKAESES